MCGGGQEGGEVHAVDVWQVVTLFCELIKLVPAVNGTNTTINYIVDGFK